MYKHEVFPHAPIAEALLDIRVERLETDDLSILKPFSEAVASSFPEKELRRFFRGGVEIREDQPPKISAESLEPTGYVYQNREEGKALQARIDGFSLSKLKPYENWEKLRDEARSYWEIYKKVCEPKTVNRIALRYINRIELPLPVTEFRDYILTSPEIAPGIPQGVLDMFFSVAVQDEDSRFFAIITSTIETNNVKDFVPYIFDIDSFSNCSIDVNSKEVWEIFEGLRDFKNLIFFNSITDRTRELFR